MTVIDPSKPTGPAMDAKVAAVGYEIWMCRDLETECPFCREEITEPAGSLAEFLVLLDEHERACPEIALATSSYPASK